MKNILKIIIIGVSLINYLFWSYFLILASRTMCTTAWSKYGWLVMLALVIFFVNFTYQLSNNIYSKSSSFFLFKYLGVLILCSVLIVLIGIYASGIMNSAFKGCGGIKRGPYYSIRVEKQELIEKCHVLCNNTTNIAGIMDFCSAYFSDKLCTLQTPHFPQSLLHR